MSTVSIQPIEMARQFDDPLCLGWRVVEHTRPDGGIDYGERPLTEEELLYPEEGDFVVTNQIHSLFMIALASSFRAKFADSPGVVVLSDCRVSWAIPGIRPLGPDVLVCDEVQSNQMDAGTFDLVETGGRPVLAIEITSPNSRLNDLVIKVELYEGAGVEWYVIIDRGRRKERSRLVGYAFTPTGRVELVPDNEGRLWIDPLGVWLALVDEWIVVIDGITGEAIPDLTAALQLVEETQQRADDERQRADDERQRADTAARLALNEKQRADTAARLALNEKQRADDERQRADDAANLAFDEKQRADDERQRANDAAKLAFDEKQRADDAVKLAFDEKQRADALEARSRDLEAELRRLRGI